MTKKTLLAAISFMVVMFSGTGISHAASAEENYKWYCSQCHGFTGKGDGVNVTKDMAVTPRNHTDSVVMSELSDQDIENAITDGGPANSKSPLMPPWGKTMTSDEIKDMVKHLRKLCNCSAKKK